MNHSLVLVSQSTINGHLRKMVLGQCTRATCHLFKIRLLVG